MAMNKEHLDAIVASKKTTPQRVRAYRNKREGVCYVTGATVLKHEGWVWPLEDDSRKGLPKYVPLTDEAAKLANLLTYDNKGMRGRGGRGITTNLSAAMAWIHVFESNEKIAANKGKPLTDEQLSWFMIHEFPFSDPKSRSPQRVRMYRSCYNRSVSPFEGRAIPDPQSKAYDREGNPLSKGAAVTRRSSGESVSRAMIAEMVRDALTKNPLPPTEVVINFQPRKRQKRKVDMAGKHAMFETVMRRVAARVPVLLVGPTGSGKTHLAGQLAEALGLDFTFNSMSEGVTESAIVGRQLPNAKGAWEYQPSPFVKTFENGGVHLFDELDAADPNLLVLVNAALANGLLSIPARGVEPAKQHEDAIIICAANTFGRGADRQYVGRNQLDEATLNRFTMGTVFIDYDRALERSIAASILNDDSKTDTLLAWAWSVRDKIEANKMRRVLSTRNIADAAKLLACDESLDTIKSTYFSGWTDDEVRKTGA